MDKQAVIKEAVLNGRYLCLLSRTSVELPLATKLIDALAYLPSNLSREYLQFDGNDYVVQSRTLQLLLTRNTQTEYKFLSRYQQLVFAEAVSNWDREFENETMTGKQLQYQNWLHNKNRNYFSNELMLAFDLVNGMTRTMAAILIANSGLRRNDLLATLSQIKFRDTGLFKASVVLRNLLQAFDKISCDGENILPRELLAYARRHDLEDLLFANE
jgi:hypothetical protein